MRSHENWRLEEVELLHRYFNSNWTPETLAINVKKINPNRSFESVLRQVRRFKDKFGYEKPREAFRKTLRVGVVDIEATHLRADFGIMICYVFKTVGKDEYFQDIITRKEIVGGAHDKRVVKSFLKNMENYDVLIAHYGEYFDFAFVRTRALGWGLEGMWPAHNTKFFIDPWRIAKKRLLLSSNRLANIISFLELDKEKTKLSGKIWNDAILGGPTRSPKALEYIKDHCIMDCVTLEMVAEKLKPYNTLPLKSL